jgi:asparagine synthase (glutamine-hydrolysing)
LPGLLITDDPNSKVYLDRLTHGKVYFDKAQTTFESCYLGLVDFSKRLRSKLLSLSEDKLGIVIYGDIYLDNFHSLQSKYKERIDIASILLEEYKLHGLDFVHRISGGFALAIHDGKNNKTYIITDRFASKPLYYSSNSDTLSVSSEIKALLLDKTGHLEFNIGSIYEFLAFWHPLSDRTLFQNIKVLPPASIFIYDHLNKQKRLERYWYYNGTIENNQSYSLYDLVDRFDQLFSRSLWQRINTADSVALFLSGGIDSRIVAAYCADICKKYNKELVFYTFGMPGCVQESVTRQLAAALGVEHRFITINGSQIPIYAEKTIAQGDGHVRIRDTHYIAASERLLLTHDIYLSAYNACIGFGSFIKKQLLTIKNDDDLASFISKERVRPNARRAAKLILKEKYQKPFANRIVDVIGETLSEIPDLPYYLKYNLWLIENYNNKYTIPIANYLDWYLPSNDPFIDKDIMDLSIDLPPELLIGKKFLHNVITIRFPKLKNIKFEQGYYINSSSATKMMRKIWSYGLYMLKENSQKLLRSRVLIKHNDYRAYAYWLRTSAREFCEYTLDSLQADNPFGLDPSGVKKMLEDHMACKIDYNTAICDVINLVMLEQYINNNRR